MTVCEEVVVSCCRLDWQRLPGQEVRPADHVVFLLRVKDELQLALSRLLGHPLALDSGWTEDVSLIHRLLHHTDDELREALAQRDSQQ